MATEGHLRRVAFADHHRAGRLEALHHHGIDLGHVLGVDRRAVGGAQPGGLGDVFDDDRYAVQRAERVAAGAPGVEGGSLLGSGLRHGDDGVEPAVERRDTLQGRTDHLAGAELSLGHQISQLQSRAQTRRAVLGLTYQNASIHGLSCG